MKKKRYSVRLYISRNGKGVIVGSVCNPVTGFRRFIYSHIGQITYNADTVYEALYKGFRYVGVERNKVTSYTVTDRTTGEKINYKVG